MNPLFAEAFEESLLEVERVAATPTLTNLGSDLSCAEDLDEDAGELAEDDPLLVAQAVVRRLSTPRGALLEDPDYGIDLSEVLSVAMTPRDRARLEGRIRGEVAKDDRIDELVIVYTDNTDTTRSLDVSIDGTTATGPFRLVMALTDGDVLVQEMTAG